MLAQPVHREAPGALQHHSPRFATRTVRRLGEGTKNVLRRLAENRRDDAANTSLAGIGAIALSIVAVIISAVVGLVILSKLFPTYSGAAANLSTNMSSADWGDPTANSLGPVFAMVVSLGALFAVVGLVFGIYAVVKGRRSA